MWRGACRRRPAPRGQSLTARALRPSPRLTRRRALPPSRAGPDILTTRTSYRPAHLANAVSYINQGLLLVGGATPDTYPAIGQPYSAYWIFSNFATPATVSAFMASDPYVTNNLVKSYRISNYTVPNVNTGAAYSLVSPGVDAAYNAQPTLNVSAAAPAKVFTALFYTYGPDIFTTRTPYRTAHLMNANTYVNASLMVIGGAYPPTDPLPYGAMFVFNQNANASVISQFIANDPYVQNNLVVRCARQAARPRVPIRYAVLSRAHSRCTMRAPRSPLRLALCTCSYFTRNWSVPLISPPVDAAAVSMYSPPPPSPPPSPPPPPSPAPPCATNAAPAAAKPVLALAAAAVMLLAL
jgi:uncharacterized protein YciI